VIIGLGSRLQVFQNADIRAITSHDEIDLELAGQAAVRLLLHHE